MRKAVWESETAAADTLAVVSGTCSTLLWVTFLAFTPFALSLDLLDGLSDMMSPRRSQRPVTIADKYTKGIQRVELQAQACEQSLLELRNSLFTFNEKQFKTVAVPYAWNKNDANAALKDCLSSVLDMANTWRRVKL